jgi:nickel-dependent lactate racemase
MNVDLLYGRNSISLRLPEDIRVTVVQKHPMIPIRNPVQAVKQALETPVGSPPLAEMARHGKSACILICDITRPVPNGTLLPPLVETITAAGISRENILILVATGLHRPNEGEELREIIGSDAAPSAPRTTSPGTGKPMWILEKPPGASRS